jgi:hypothetical protein
MEGKGIEEIKKRMQAEFERIRQQEDAPRPQMSIEQKLEILYEAALKAIGRKR